MKTLFEKLSKENQKKVSNCNLNILENFKSYKYAVEPNLHIATEIFWAIYPMKPFDLELYFKLFK